MALPVRARRVARIADIAATVLLVLPFVVLAWDYSDLREFHWLRGGGNADMYEVPRVVVAGFALAAAVQLRLRFGRAIGVGLGCVALLGALASQFTADGGEYWARYDVLGDRRPWANWPWIAATALSLALVPRRSEPVAARLAAAQVRGVARWTPAALAVTAGAALAALAWGRIEAIYESRCSSKNEWLDTNILQGTAELAAACLILVPATRRPGLRFAALLFQGTAVWSACQWRDDAPGRDYVGLGGIEGIWAAQTAIGAAFALVFALAYLRELRVHALCAFARHSSTPHRSRVPALLVRLRAFRRSHRDTGARFVWAAPVAALGLAFDGAKTLSWTARDVLVPYVYEGAAHERTSEVLAALAAVQIAASVWLLRADRRFRGAVAGIVATFSTWGIHMASSDAWRYSDLFLPALYWVGIAFACAMSQSGMRWDEPRRVRRQLARTGGSLRAFSHRLFSTQ